MIELLPTHPSSTANLSSVSHCQPSVASHIAAEFFVGSFFFFEGVPDKDTGVWLFVVGSAQLAIRPVIRFSRRFTLRRLAGRGYHESTDDF